MKLVYVLLGVSMIACLQAPLFAKQKAHKRSLTHSYAHSYTHAHMTAPLIYGPAQLNNTLNDIISNSGHARADIAVYVKSMKYGDVLYSHNINQPMTPASTMKILTAEAALIYLGPDYRFSTQLLTDAKGVKNGVLQGNLYVVFSGDPSLTYSDIMGLLQTLRNQQIQAIAGNVYIDNTAYDQRFYGPGWEWKDRKYSYAAPISASIINHNFISFAVAPSKITGRAAQLVTSSNYYYPSIKNSVITSAKRKGACSVHLSNEVGNNISIDGCLPRGDTYGIGFVVTDIPEYNRSLFKNSLSRMGISVYGRVTFGSAPENLALIGQHASKPLRALVFDMLKKSDNVIAGALFKKLGQLYSHQQGSWENGSMAVRQILAKHANVNTNGMNILDGSGLSTNNYATPAQMMRVLEFAYHNDRTSHEFISALPISGVDGTLKHRMWNIARRVHAKTGSLPLTGVFSLAGYTTSGENEALAFVIMINGRKGMGWQYKSIEDKVTTALTRYKRLR